jgi:hypothetical protein
MFGEKDAGKRQTTWKMICSGKDLLRLRHGTSVPKGSDPYDAVSPDQLPQLRRL